MGQYPGPAKLTPWENVPELREVRQGRPEGLSTKEGGRKRIDGGIPVGTGLSPARCFL